MTITQREITAPDVLMDMQECADYLGVKKRTLQDNWRGWSLPACRVGRSLRFRLKDVSAWLDAHRESGPLW